MTKNMSLLLIHRGSSGGSCSINHRTAKIQSIGGKSDVGQHYANNNGISFVRAGRELELSIKGFFSNSEPRNRWHGIEVRFDPQLDEYFGVPNNKQAVRDFRNYDENELATLNQTVENSEGFEKHSAKMKLDLHSTITRMVRANQKKQQAEAVATMLDRTVQAHQQNYRKP